MNHSGNNKLHKWLMVLCCALPVAIIGVMYLTKVRGTAGGNLLSMGALLICPLMHLVMMPLLMGKKDNDTGDNKPSCH